MEFRIGDVAIHRSESLPAMRVPSRDPSTGRVTPEFQRMFADKRAETLAPWAAKSRFNHYYRLAVNTRIPASEGGKLIRRSGHDSRFSR